MRKVDLYRSAILVVIIILASINQIKAQDQQEAMKAWQEYMTPGNMHQIMAKDTGEWKMTISQWMDPSQAPMKSEGTCSNTMILGGRYLQSNQSSSVMGMPMNGINIIGFDNGKKIFQSVWIDNMGTGIMFAEGPWDDATNTITMKGKMFDPISKMDEDVRETYKIIDENHRVLELYVTQNGQEIKNLQADYERK
jgi:hypothetical protein